MAGQRHRFQLSSSFSQYLSLTVLAAICLSSFLAWPALDYPFYLSFKYLCLLLMLAGFGLALWRLRRWQLCFWLNELGEGQFEPGSSFELSGRPWISPFVVTFTYQGEDNYGRCWLFADMFDDTDYRHLCRLLLQRSKSAN
ncbi:MAG: protein YgfX [Shewanella algae]